jgi:hypothetical protein
VQEKQKRAYALIRGKQMVIGFVEGKTYVKMKKVGKKKSIASN